MVGGGEKTQLGNIWADVLRFQRRRGEEASGPTRKDKQLPPFCGRVNTAVNSFPMELMDLQPFQEQRSSAPGKASLIST